MLSVKYKKGIDLNFTNVALNIIIYIFFLNLSFKYKKFSYLVLFLSSSCLLVYYLLLYLGIKFFWLPKNLWIILFQYVRVEFVKVTINYKLICCCFCCSSYKIYFYYFAKKCVYIFSLLSLSQAKCELFYLFFFYLESTFFLYDFLFKSFFFQFVKITNTNVLYIFFR